MRKRLLVKQMARFSQPVHDHRIGGEDLLASSQSGASPVNRPDSSTGLKRKPVGSACLVVLRTIAGRGVDQPHPSSTLTYWASTIGLARSMNG